MRWFAFFLGVFYVDFLFHSSGAKAFGFEAETLPERLWALFFVLVMTLAFYYITLRFFPPSFFHGVIFASGFFASFDVVVIHWVFQLHRLTDGPEANIIEPVLVVIGIIMMFYALKKENKLNADK
ncbi:hypothetical protein [Alkalicoccus daliensis]|uniref:Uncharacterized protein n=1 Tax=Alkalicoccus daliensis TaxID=745820 RepID=A0A1H0HJ83_9BACI|nr:hypothetical protein [Alkalicoccus daliensis]SDO19266.1 hypothetical protein SAMN04488053_108127 [Alkalicoccus daliensis]